MPQEIVTKPFPVDTPFIPERVAEMIQEGVNLSRLERIEKLNDCLLMVMNDFQQEFGEGGWRRWIRCPMGYYCDPKAHDFSKK